MAIHIYEEFQEIIKHFIRTGYPAIDCSLIIGGVDIKYQLDDMNKGVHLAIATPGRLSDFIEKRRITLDLCRLIVMDEADRLLDLGFNDEMIIILKAIKVFKFNKAINSDFNFLFNNAKINSKLLKEVVI